MKALVIEGVFSGPGGARCGNGLLSIRLLRPKSDTPEGDVAGQRCSARTLLSKGVCEAVGIGAGLDDGAVKREPVDDRGAKPRVGEGLRPPGEGLVGRDRDRVLLLAFG